MEFSMNYTTLSSWKVGNRMLLEMAEFLETNPRGFDLMFYARPGGVHFTDPRIGCGSTACALGFSPAIWPDEYEWSHSGGLLCHGDELDYYCHFIERFCIDRGEYELLFEPSSYPRESRLNPLAVAERIRKFVAERRKVK